MKGIAYSCNVLQRERKGVTKGESKEKAESTGKRRQSLKQKRRYNIFNGCGPCSTKGGEEDRL
jgi:hypothetical protein